MEERYVCGAKCLFNTHRRRRTQGPWLKWMLRLRACTPLLFDDLADMPVQGVETGVRI